MDLTDLAELDFDNADIPEPLELQEDIEQDIDILIDAVDGVDLADEDV